MAADAAGPAGDPVFRRALAEHLDLHRFCGEGEGLSEFTLGISLRRAEEFFRADWPRQRAGFLAREALRNRLEGARRG